MPRKYWFDTCIWRDFYEDRLNRQGDPIGKYASMLYLKIVKEKGVILFSESLIWEMRKDYDESGIDEMLGLLFACGALIKIGIKEGEIQEARSIADERRLPFADCLIAVQARDNDAVIVSRDRHFF
jgi:hypothetical protein